MKLNENNKNQRPLSHCPLLMFPKNDDYIMNNPKELVKEKQWQNKFTLQNLREKWTRKVNVNFHMIDNKFGKKESKEKKLINKEKEDEEKFNKKIFDIRHGFYCDNSEVKQENTSSHNNKKFTNIKSKYDKLSYYLSSQKPWNNNTKLEREDKKIIDLNIEKSIDEAHKSNERINLNNKSYKSIKERFKISNTLMKKAKNNKFIEREKNKLYKKILLENPEIEKYPEKINALIFKGMINLYQEYAKYIESKNLFDKKFEDKPRLRTKHIFTDKEIFDKLTILMAYLKVTKEKIDQKEFLKNFFIDYNKVIEKEKYLKNIDLKYQKYLSYLKSEMNNNSSGKKNIFISRYPIQKNSFKGKNSNFFSSEKLDLDDLEEKKEKSKNIHYFLTAYKDVFDERQKLRKSQERKLKINKLKNELKDSRHLVYLRTETNKEKEKEHEYEQDQEQENKEKKETNKNNENNNKNERRSCSTSKRDRERPLSSGVKISYFHPGSYYKFSEKDKEFYAWTCCMNEDKSSKGCAKKVKKYCSFNYDDRII